MAEGVIVLGILAVIAAGVAGLFAFLLRMRRRQ